jgi:prepilin-type processing-associated H-X9-DG protein
MTIFWLEATKQGWEERHHRQESFRSQRTSPVAWNDTRHLKQGNVGLADGSVQGFSSNKLREALANTGVETNRLAMP